MEQVLYDLPEGWDWQTFDDVCTNITDGAHASPKTADEGFPYVTVRDVNHKGQIDLINCKRISKDDFLSLKKGNCLPPVDSVLLSKDGTVGKVAHVTSDYDEFVVLSSLAIIIPEKQRLSPEYLKYFLLSPEFQEYAIGSKTGAAIKRIVLRTIKNFNIPIAPLEQQKRIVEKLDALLTRIDSAIEYLQESVTLANALYASYVNTLLTPPEKPLDSYNVTSSAESWEWKKIEDVFTITSGKNLTKKDMVEEGKYAVYGGNGIAGRFTKFNLDGTNIIIGRVGALCGNVRLISEKIWLTDNAFFIKEYKIDISKEFLTKVLGALNLGDTANKAAQPVISYKSIKELKIPYPSLSQQDKIVNDLNALYSKQQKNYELLQGKIESLRQLKASILDSAFKGEL